MNTLLCQPLRAARRDIFFQFPVNWLLSKSVARAPVLQPTWAVSLVCRCRCSDNPVWIWTSPSSSLSQSPHLYVQEQKSLRLCWALCGRWVPSPRGTCVATCFSSWERLEHWDYSRNILLSFPFVVPAPKQKVFILPGQMLPSLSHGRRTKEASKPKTLEEQL